MRRVRLAPKVKAPMGWSKLQVLTVHEYKRLQNKDTSGTKSIESDNTFISATRPRTPNAVPENCSETHFSHSRELDIHGRVNYFNVYIVV